MRGVIFTGSTEVAQPDPSHARRALTRPADPLLIAETGGQNAMIVDSSALTEQVVQDVLASAFDSAGQRCSALRVLCLQEDIADRVLEMLKGAMQELARRRSRPARHRRRPGDRRARRSSAAERHIETMRATGQAVLPAAAAVRLRERHLCTADR